MNDSINGSDRHGVRVAWVLIVLNVEIRGKRVPDLAGVCKIGLQSIDGGVGKGVQIQVQDAVTSFEEIWNHMTASFP